MLHATVVLNLTLESAIFVFIYLLALLIEFFFSNKSPPDELQGGLGNLENWESVRSSHFFDLLHDLKIQP